MAKAQDVVVYLGGPGDAMRTSTMFRHGSVGIRRDQADWLISVLRLPSKTQASRQILSQSNSLSSGKDCTRRSMACWMGHSSSISNGGKGLEGRKDTS